jgi:hypothetical protein
MSLLNEEEIKDNIKKEFRMCPNEGCENSCFGKQCSGCHIKMINERSNNFKECCDCNKKFYAIRRDGSFRMRCRECQEEYNNNHISVCVGCEKSYHSRLSNGKVYDKCYECYQKTMNTKCESCNNKSFGRRLCKPCYEFSRKSMVYEKKKCDNEWCDNITTYPVCSTCKFSE